jgi:uncharacterized membrane protein
MGKVNLSRVILGGIVAGIIVNVSEGLLHNMVMKTQFEEALKALGKTPPHSGTALFWWLVWGFIMGITAVWLYAAIRPRYGPGPATAARAGIAAWILSCVLMTIAMANLDLFPFNPLVLVWTLVEAIIATIAGAALYKEVPA